MLGEHSPGAAFDRAIYGLPVARKSTILHDERNSCILSDALQIRYKGNRISYGQLEANSVGLAGSEETDSERDGFPAQLFTGN